MSGFAERNLQKGICSTRQPCIVVSGDVGDDVG